MNGLDRLLEEALKNIHFGFLINCAIRAIADRYTFKGLVLIPLLWWAWFYPGVRRAWCREVVIATIVSAIFALIVGRLMAHFLPFRLRPLYTPGLSGHFPFEAAKSADLMAWSSFPSDHAMLWAAVATGIFLISWRAGLLAFLYTLVFICAPRFYLGYHYPTDLLAGIALGIATTCVLTRDSVRTWFGPPSLRWMERYPGVFSMLAFVLSLELVTQFDDIRTLVESAFKVM
ncbi:phosphatase PAP2 family protein [Paraburkholderia sp. J12]|uniref:phosphatase PAP2 family protein n=1 Tax=Paraburkholderia sp. J12 TaxID=2805432 RepID=UPI002ABE5B31|nr:phosphatase PAP2 family protein [Paraburkholderia sp. J12]